MDISELKYVESQLRLRTKALEESESKYRNYAEHCPLGIARTDGQGYVQYGNDAWHNHYGFVRGQVKDPQPWLPHIHEDYLDAWKECYDSFQKNPGPRAIELRLKDKVYTMNDGDHVIQNGVYVLITGFSEFMEDGTVDYIDFWVTDISSQKMAAKVLADKMEEAIRLKTQQERFIDMISHEIRNPLSAVLHCGEEVIETMKICLEQLSTLPDAQPHSVHAVCTELSGHIQSSLDAASTIMYCVQHQKQIVDDVLTLSKLDGDLLVVSPVPVQPVQLVRTSLKIFEPELKMTDIALSVVEDQSLSNLGIEWVLIDPNRFLQIVINLVTNAIKFTRTSPTRNITVTVSAFHESPAGIELGVQYVPRRYAPATPTSPTGDYFDEYDITGDVYLCFNVTDTGKGLTSAEQLLLFNRFAQASPRTHIEYGGSGLGLFISRQITEMLGGEIGMSSTAGSGVSDISIVIYPTSHHPPFSFWL
jgi:PAS domain S-box-containing protein